VTHLLIEGSPSDAQTAAIVAALSQLHAGAAARPPAPGPPSGWLAAARAEAVERLNT